MANSVMFPIKTSAQYDGSKIETFINAGADIDNGTVFVKSTLSTATDESEVYTLTLPATGAGLTNLYMAYTSELNMIVGSDGNEYRVGDLNPKNFTNYAGYAFNGFKLTVGDRIKITGDGLGGTKSTNTFVVATNGTGKLTWAAAAVSGVSLKLVKESYFSIPEGGIGSQRTVAYVFEVVAVA